MNVKELYEHKLSSATNAVKLIPTQGNIAMGMRVATPPAICTALASRARAGEIEKLKVYYLRCGEIALKTIFNPDLFDIIIPYSSMLSKGEINLANEGFKKNKKYINFVPVSFSEYPEIIKQHIELDAFIVTVSSMDKFGYFSFGTNGDYAIELSRYAKKLIVEVNENMPKTFGQALIHVSEIDAIVENTVPLLEEPSRPCNEIEKKIGDLITPLIPNGATIQMGIGNIPNSICERLTQHKNLGIHTEVITAGLINLIKKGVVNNSQKSINRYLNVFTFAIGDVEVYEYINNNPSMACMPVSYVNNSDIIAEHDNIISVNSFIEIDLTGQVNSEFLKHQFSGAGGQLDFIRGANKATCGKAILASCSTAKGGSISKIIPRLHSVTTDTRLDVDYVVTEYGITKLKGKSTSERALCLIDIAHPKFRNELLEAAKKYNIIGD